MIRSKEEAREEVERLRERLHEVETQMKVAKAMGEPTNEFESRCQSISVCALSIIDDWELYEDA